MVFRIIPGADFAARMLIVMVVGILVAFVGRCLHVGGDGDGDDARFSWTRLGQEHGHAHGHGQEQQQRGRISASINPADLGGVVAAYVAFMGVVALLF